MSEVKKIATRESYGNALAELGAQNPNIVVLDADLAGATKTGVFKKAFPERHIDCGIAEGNMMGVAAGLATCGKIPFASSFAMFAADYPYFHSICPGHLPHKGTGCHHKVISGKEFCSCHDYQTQCRGKCESHDRLGNRTTCRSQMCPKSKCHKSSQCNKHACHYG